MRYEEVLEKISKEYQEEHFRKDVPVKKLGSSLSGEQGVANQAFAISELHETPDEGNKSLLEGHHQLAKDPFVPEPSPEMEKEIDEIINGSMRADALLRGIAGQIVHYNTLENPRTTYRRAIYEAIRTHPDIYKQGSSLFYVGKLNWSCPSLR
jgi:hypothetical protein